MKKVHIDDYLLEFEQFSNFFSPWQKVEKRKFLKRFNHLKSKYLGKCYSAKESECLSEEIASLLKNNFFNYKYVVLNIYYYLIDSNEISCGLEEDRFLFKMLVFQEEEVQYTVHVKENPLK